MKLKWAHENEKAKMLKEKMYERLMDSCLVKPMTPSSLVSPLPSN